MTETAPSLLGNAITIDDERIKSHLDRVVRDSVAETLNALLDAEADRLCNAQRYERSEARRDTRPAATSASCRRRPARLSCGYRRLRTQTFETAIIERYRQRESSVEESTVRNVLTTYTISRDPWHLRRRQSGQGGLERLPQAS
jgi:putative transposase